MFPFYLFVILLVFGTYLAGNTGKSKNKNPKKAMFIFSFLVILFFCGGIDGARQGGDISNYYSHVVQAKQLTFSAYSDSSSFEIGYKVFVWTIANIFQSKQIFMFIQYGFVNFIFLLFCYKNCDDYYLAMLCYVFYGGFTFYLTAFRQAITCAICLIAVMLLQKKKFFLPLLLILFATLFHQTAIVFLPFLFIRNLKISKSSVAWFSFGTIIVAIFLDQIVDLANEQFDMKYGKQIIASWLGPLISLVIFAFVFYLLFLQYQKHNKGNEIEPLPNDMLVFMALSALVLYMMRYLVLAIERVSFYFQPAMAPLAAYALNTISKSQTKKTVRILFIALSSVLFIVRCEHTFGGVHLIY